MAVIKCSNCGKYISTNAEKCIHCGADNERFGEAKVVTIEREKTNNILNGFRITAIIMAGLQIIGYIIIGLAFSLEFGATTGLFFVGSSITIFFTYFLIALMKALSAIINELNQINSHLSNNSKIDK